MPTNIAQIRGGVGRARAGRHPGHWQLGVVPLLQATRTIPIVFVTCRRSGRRRLRRKPGAAGRQRHRVHLVRIRHQREMAGAAQRDRARRDASGGPSGSGHRRRDGQFGAIQSAAPSLGVEVSPVDVRDAGEIERAVTAFARGEWRPDRDGGRVGDRSSRSDHRAGGPAPVARGLLGPLLRHRRRPDLLRA